MQIRYYDHGPGGYNLLQTSQSVSGLTGIGSYLKDLLNLVPTGLIGLPSGRRSWMYSQRTRG